MNLEQSTQQESSDEIEIDLVAEFILIKNLIKKNFIWILLLGLLGAAGGYFYAKSQKAVYAARFKFTVKLTDMSGGMSALSGIASLMGTGGGADPFAKIIELAGAERIVGKALFTPAQVNGKQDLLINHFMALEELKKEWIEDSTLREVRAFKPAVYNVQNLTYSERMALFIIISKLVGGEEDNSTALLQRSYDKKTGIISLQANHWNEDFAIALSQAVYQELVDFHTFDSYDKMSLNVRNVKNKVDSIRNALLTAQMSSAKKSDQTLGLVMQEDQVAQKSLNIRENMLIVMLGEAQKNYETLVLMQQSTKPNFTIIKEPFSPITPSKKSKILFALAPFFLLIVGSIFLLRIRIFLANLLTRVKI
jgi:hypothetical protein